MSLRSFLGGLVGSSRSRVETLNHDGVVLLEQGKLDDALARFEEAISVDPKDERAYLNRGAIWARKKDWPAVLAECETAMRLNPASLVAYNLRSMAKHATGDQQGALADANQALRHGNWAIALHNRGCAYAAMHDDDRALGDFDEAIRLDAGLVDAWVGRAGIWTRRDDHGRAIADLDQVIRLKPNRADFHVSRATHWIALREFARAIDDCTAAIRLSPQNALAHVHRANALVGLNRTDEALSDCNEAIRLNPRLAEGFLQRASILFRRQRYDEALADFDEAIKINPNSGFAFYTRSLVHQLRGDLRQALADANEGVRLAPKDAVAYNNRGFMRMKSGDFGGAVDDYLEAIRLNRDHPNAHKNLAWLQATCPDERFRTGLDAVRNTNRAIELAGGQHPEWQEILAAAYAELGDFGAAVRWQEKALGAANVADQSLAQERLAGYRSHHPWREAAS
jgi:tetratricopeptide (TPR) repeat protein